MGIFSRNASGVILFLSMMGSARAAHTLLPAPSTWALNAAKCDFGGVPGMKSDVWRILVDNERQFKYTDTMTLESGEVVQNSWDGPQDGSMRPVPGWPGVKMGFNLATDTARSEMPDGSTMIGVMSLSKDGKVLTLKMDIHAKDGSVAHQTLIYERTT